MRTIEREPRPASLAVAWHALADDLVGMVSDRVHLLALELHRARLVTFEIVALMLAAALLIGVAWLLIGLLGAVALVEAGWPWLGALATVLAINLALGIAALLRARSLVPKLALPGTMRRLMVTSLPAQAEQPSQPQPYPYPTSSSAPEPDAVSVPPPAPAESPQETPA